MANTNQIVSLEIQVIETGAIKVSTIAQDLNKLGQTAIDSSTGMVKLNDSMGKGTISGREMSMAVGSISEAFGTANPAMSQALIHSSRFIEAMQGASLSSQITAGAVVGLGAAVAATFAIFAESEKVAARFAGIGVAIGSLNLTALISDASKTTVEIDKLDRETSSWTGTAVVGLRNILAILPGVPNEIEVATQAMEKLKAGIVAVLPLYQQLESAKTTQVQVGLETAGLQAYTQNMISTVQLSRGDEAAYDTAMQALIEKNRTAANSVAYLNREKSFMTSSTSGTLNEESPLIQQTYTDTVAANDMKARVELETLSGTVQKMGNVISATTGNVMGIELKYVADVGSAWRGGEELKQSLTDQTTAWTTNETDKRIADVDRWEAASLDKIWAKEGYTRDSETLEEQVVSDASTRRVQIYQQEGDKIRAALAGRTDAFEEAYRLQGIMVTVTQQGILASYTPYFDQIERMYGNDTGAYIADIEKKKVELNQQLLDGTITEQTYYTVLAQLRKKEDEQYALQIQTQLMAHGIMIDQKLKAEADYANSAEAIRRTNLRNDATSLIAQADATGNMWLAVEAGTKMAYASMLTWGQETAAATVEAWKAVDTNLQTGFFDVMTGNFSDLGNVAKKFGDDLINIFAKVMADQATKGLIDLLPSIGGMLSSAVSWVGGLFMSEGGVVPGHGTDTIPAMLSPGELVLKPEMASAFMKLYNYITTYGQAEFVEDSELASALVSSTPEFSDLGLASATTLSNTGAAALFPTGMGIGEEAMGITGNVASALPGLVAPGIMIASTLYGVWQNMMSVKAGEEARGRALEAQIDAIFSAYPTVVAALRGGDTQAEQAVATAIGTSPGWIDSTGINQFAQYGIPDSVAKAVGIDWWWNTVGNAGMMSQSAGSGMIGDTAGPTRLTVGEAGKETVAVLRNPRQVDLAAAAGQGGGAGGGDIHFTINIDARGSLADANQLHLLVRNKFIPEIARIARTFTRSNSRSGGRPIFETGG